MAILAGGIASRLGELSLKRPKLLMEVAGEPFFSHQARLLRKSGLRRVILCVGHLGSTIEEEIGDGSDFGIEVSYSYDGLKPRGTGGALLTALPLLGENFFVLYGDSYLTCDYLAVGEAFLRARLKGLMTIFKNDNDLEPSNVCFDGTRITEYCKRGSTNMMYIDYGLSLLNQKALSGFDNTAPIDLSAIYQKLIAEGQLAAFEVQDRFYQIGSLSGLKELDLRLRQSTS